MQHAHFRPAVKFFVLLFAAISLVSFTSPAGGDVFEIYLNKKLVFQQFVNAASPTVKSFQLDKSNYNASIDVVYNHCGHAGISRVIKITDAKDHVLKQFSFGTGKDSKSAMSFVVKDIMLAQKDKDIDKLNIYYSSEQLPKGMLLAAVVLVDHNAKP
jgi:hypothetical protein